MQWLQENLAFEYPNDSEILRIRLLTPDADGGAKVLNAVVDAFFKEIVEKKVLDRLKEESLVRKLYEEKRERIMVLTREVRSMIKANGDDQAQDSPEIAPCDRPTSNNYKRWPTRWTRSSQQLEVQKHEPLQILKFDEAMVEIFRDPPKDGV